MLIGGLDVSVSTGRNRTRNRLGKESSRAACFVTLAGGCLGRVEREAARRGHGRRIMLQ